MASQDITCPKPASPMEKAGVPESASAAVVEPSLSASVISVPPQPKRKSPTSELKQRTLWVLLELKPNMDVIVTIIIIIIMTTSV